MAVNVTLSLASIEYIEQWHALTNSKTLFPSASYSDCGDISLRDLGEHFLLKSFDENNAEAQKTCFLRESLRVSLLIDIHQAIAPRSPDTDNTFDDATWLLYIQCGWLAFSGVFFGVCDGFDGISAIFSLFAAVPFWIIFLVGAVFSMLSVVVFCAFDLVQISQNLGLKINQSIQLLDLLMQQCDEVRAICNQMQNELCDEGVKSQNLDLDDWLLLSDCLKYSYTTHLTRFREVYAEKLNDPALAIFKYMTALSAGILFFGYGFFAGQTLGVFVFTLILGSAAALPTLWPIILISCISGCAAFSLYWFIERLGVENLVSSCMGLDREKIDTFLNQEKIITTKEALNHLTGTLRDKQTIRKLTKGPGLWQGELSDNIDHDGKCLHPSVLKS